MNERDRFGRSRDQVGFGQQQRRPWDRQRYQAESTGYPDEDRDRGYSRLGGAGEEDYERYQSGAAQGYQTPREYDREYGGREPQYSRDYGDERGYYGPERGYGQERGGQGSPYGQRDWGRSESIPGGGMQRSQRHAQGPSGQYGSAQYGQSTQRERGQFAGRGPKGYKRSDERIREDLCDALMMDPEIDASEIEVNVSDGEVTITGSVQEREDKWRAEQLAEAIPGVRDVHNTIRARRGGNEQTASSTSDSARNAPRGGASSSGSNVSQGGLGNGTRS